MSDMNDTIRADSQLPRLHRERRATADVAADPAVCALAALAMSAYCPPGRRGAC